MRIRSWTLLVFALLGSKTLAQVTELPKEFDAYVERTLKTFNVPGMAVAVVKDGKVLVAKGYGTTSVGGSRKVDGSTLFSIASNTKAFTSLALCLLAEQGKLELDAPVQRYLPWFALSDPYVSREITVRDLLVHRSGLGLGAGDLLWWPGTTLTRKQVVQKLRYLPLKTSFRSAYAYDNVLYMVAGEVVEAVSGKSYEDFVRDAIFRKVGMGKTAITYAEAEKIGGISEGNAPVEGAVKVVPPFKLDAFTPAGGIYTGAEDAAKWLKVLLSGGVLPDGSRLFSPQTQSELWSIVTPLKLRPSLGPFAEIAPKFAGYALGFVALDYRGHRLISHTGGMPGFVSTVSLMPELGLGIAIFTNQESEIAFQSIQFYLQDHFCGAKSTDWIGAFTKALGGAARPPAVMPAKLSNDSKPSLPLKSYAGTYRDAWYGDVVLTESGGRLTIKFANTPVLVGELEHWQFDTFLVKWKDRSLRGDAFITFSLNAEGKIEHAKMAAATSDVDFSYDFQDLLLMPVG